MNQKCERCGAPEVASSSPRTTYACGSSDYDQRPGSFDSKCGRYCMHCLRGGGVGPRELRPYGPGGRDVCAECTFNGPPERLKQAEKQLGARLFTAEPLLLDAREQVGPRLMTPEEKRRHARTIEKRRTKKAGKRG